MTPLEKGIIIITLSVVLISFIIGLTILIKRQIQRQSKIDEAIKDLWSTLCYVAKSKSLMSQPKDRLTSIIRTSVTRGILEEQNRVDPAVLDRCIELIYHAFSTKDIDQFRQAFKNTVQFKKY